MNRERWFDSDCKTVRKTLRKVSNQKHRNPDSQELRLTYGETLKQYKNTHKKRTISTKPITTNWRVSKVKSILRKLELIYPDGTTNSPFKMEINGKIILKISIELSNWISVELPLPYCRLWPVLSSSLSHAGAVGWRSQIQQTTQNDKEGWWCCGGGPNQLIGLILQAHNTNWTQVFLIKLQLFHFTVFSSSSSSFLLLLLSLLSPFLVWLVVKHVAKHYHPVLCFTLLVNFTPTQHHQLYTYFWNIW